MERLIRNCKNMTISELYDYYLLGKINLNVPYCDNHSKE